MDQQTKAAILLLCQMDVGLLREISVWSYERSIARYSSIKEAMGQPDVIQWHYRTLIFDTVRHIVLSQISPAKASLQIKKILATQVKPEHQMHLQEIIETELIYLYSGNIARYQISFEEYEKWAKEWRRS